MSSILLIQQTDITYIDGLDKKYDLYSPCNKKTNYNMLNNGPNNIILLQDWLPL